VLFADVPSWEWQVAALSRDEETYVKGINGQGNIQKGFIVPTELWDAVGAKAQKDRISVSDVLRTGMMMYLDGDLKVEHPWQQGRKKGAAATETQQPANQPHVAKKTPAKTAPAKTAPAKKTPPAKKSPPAKTTSSRHLRAVEPVQNADEPQPNATSVPAGG
jgi:hypothetical protein